MRSLLLTEQQTWGHVLYRDAPGQRGGSQGAAPSIRLGAKGSQPCWGSSCSRLSPPACSLAKQTGLSGGVELWFCKQLSRRGLHLPLPLPAGLALSWGLLGHFVLRMGNWFSLGFLLFYAFSNSWKVQ